MLSALALTLAGIFYALVPWLGASTWFFLNAVAAAFVLLIVFDPLRTAVEQKIGEIIPRERSQFESQVLTLRPRLPRLLTLEAIAEEVVGALEGSSRFTHGALFLLSADGLTLVRRGCFGPLPVPELEVAAARPLLDRIAGDEPVRRVMLQRERDALRQSEEKDVRKVESLGGALAVLAELQADAVFPVRGEVRLLGLLAVKDDRMPEGFAAEDLALLSGLAVQIAIAAENIELYRQMKVRDRLAVVGEMSAGLAHEIRNPLGSIKAAAQILAEDSPPDDKGMLEVLVEESNRLNRVVTEFLEYARPQGGIAAASSGRCSAAASSRAGGARRRGTCDLAVGDGLPDVSTRSDCSRSSSTSRSTPRKPWAAPGGRDRRRHAARLRPGRAVASPRRRPLPRPRTRHSRRSCRASSSPSSPPRSTAPGWTAISQRIVEDAGGTIEALRGRRGTDFAVVLPAAAPANEKRRSARSGPWTARRPQETFQELFPPSTRSSTRTTIHAGRRRRPGRGSAHPRRVLLRHDDQRVPASRRRAVRTSSAGGNGAWVAPERRPDDAAAGPFHRPHDALGTGHGAKHERRRRGAGRRGPRDAPGPLLQRQEAGDLDAGTAGRPRDAVGRHRAVEQQQVVRLVGTHGARPSRACGKDGLLPVVVRAEADEPQMGGGGGGEGRIVEHHGPTARGGGAFDRPQGMLLGEDGGSGEATAVELDLVGDDGARPRPDGHASAGETGKSFREPQTGRRLAGAAQRQAVHRDGGDLRGAGARQGGSAAAGDEVGGAGKRAEEERRGVVRAFHGQAHGSTPRGGRIAARRSGDSTSRPFRGTRS